MKSLNLWCAPRNPPAARQLAAPDRSNDLPLLLCAVLLVLVSLPAFAGSASATMQVSVTVLAQAVVTVNGQPEAVVVTDADVARGYVDVVAPISLFVRTNSRAGYMLQVDRMVDAFSRVDLTFGDAAMSVADQAWMSRPYVPGGESLTLRARVHLAAGAQAGSYPLMMAISARPL